MNRELIFITGATGFIGATTVLVALEKGYRLRISVRKEVQTRKLKAVFSSYLGSIEFVIVPDITAPGAFAGKLYDVSVVIHLASPLASDSTNKDDYFQPAVQGTTEILSEAAKVSSIRRVILTASIATLLPLGGQPKGTIREYNSWEQPLDAKLPLFKLSASPPPMLLYQASKILAAQAAESFLSKASPSFDLVTIHPGFVYGHNILQSSAAELAGLNGSLFQTIMTGQVVPGGSLLTRVHIKDVAEVHIKAIDSEVEPGRYLVTAPGQSTWADVVEVLRVKFPSIGWKLSDAEPAQGWPVDVGKASKTFGIRWRDWDEIIEDVVTQQLQLSQASLEG